MRCDKCGRGFEAKRSLNKHSKDCRSDDRKHIKIQKDGEYPCDICEKVMPNRSSFKSHIFHIHTNSETKGTFNSPLQKFIGKSFLKKFRKTFLGSLKKGELEHKIFKEFKLNNESIEAV